MLALLALLVASADGAPTPKDAAPAAADAPIASDFTPRPSGRSPAADGLRILVVAPGAATARVEEIYSGLRAAGLSPVELDERSGVDREGGMPQQLGDREQARTHLQEAKARLRDLDIEGTRSACDAVIDEVLRLERPEESMEILADALLLRANAALQRGVEDEARQALVLLARLTPSLTELHPGLHAPSLVEAFAAARIDEAGRAAGALVVRPRVAGFHTADLMVDGQPVVTLAMPLLRQGPHLVTVRARGTIPFSRIVDLGTSPLVLEPFLGPADAAARRTALVAQARDADDEVARARSLDAVASLSAARAVLYLDASGVRLHVAGRGLEMLRAQASADGALIGRAALTALQAPAQIDPSLAVAAEVDPALLVGGVALGLVMVSGAVIAGLVLLAEGAPPPPPPRPLDFTCCVQ